jgi:hypothetical protein
MMKKFFTTTTLFLCGVAICLAAIAADLTGKWNGSVKGPDGDTEFPLTYVFKAEGNVLTGTLTSPQGDTPITEGKIDGTNFSFKIAFGDMSIANKGKFYGDSVGIDSDFGGQNMHITLKRAK